eukprot:TRINITY_DN67751_c0_g1_i1.p1 TRINITY_DN67751_c0_g1~~TRINITY_DN67751_c0_g1_i1.p1  ORF type:complete len:385 (+),score=28.80 TRINITY_DN67751_c0_g1_i1:39-1193(+)
MAFVLTVKNTFLHAEDQEANALMLRTSRHLRSSSVPARLSTEETVGYTRDQMDDLLERVDHNSDSIDKAHCCSKERDRCFKKPSSSPSTNYSSSADDSDGEIYSLDDLVPDESDVEHPDFLMLDTTAKEHNIDVTDRQLCKAKESNYFLDTSSCGSQLKNYRPSPTCSSSIDLKTKYQSYGKACLDSLFSAASLPSPRTDDIAGVRNTDTDNRQSVLSTSPCRSQVKNCRPFPTGSSSADLKAKYQSYGNACMESLWGANAAFGAPCSDSSFRASAPRQRRSPNDSYWPNSQASSRKTRSTMISPSCTSMMSGSRNVVYSTSNQITQSDSCAARRNPIEEDASSNFASGFRLRDAPATFGASVSSLGKRANAKQQFVYLSTVPS